MRKSIGLLVPALLVLVAFSSHAAIVSNTYYITVGPFAHATNNVCINPVTAPVDPLQLAFSISFDNSVEIHNSAANITLISLNMPNNGSLLYTYLPNNNDNLAVGDDPSSANAVHLGTDAFTMLMFQFSTSPIVAHVAYTVSSPANATQCVFEASDAIVSVGPPWTHVQFPMTGLRLGQTIRLNMVAGPVSVPGPGPCEALLNIYDSANKLVASQSVSPPGNVSVDYSLRSALSAGGRPALRKELRPEVILMPLPGTADGACQGQATAEVYDDLTKSTSAIISERNPGPGGLPAGQFGPVGVGFLQTLRFNVAAFPPNPCSGTVSFTDVEGNPIRAASPVSLTGGQATFVDLPGTAIPSDSGHGEVMAVFTQTQTPGAVVQGTCVPSVEVYDQLTGTTQAILPPEKNPGPGGVPGQ
jgi:hypothetical protein